MKLTKEYEVSPAIVESVDEIGAQSDVLANIERRLLMLEDFVTGNTAIEPTDKAYEDGGDVPPTGIYDGPSSDDDADSARLDKLQAWLDAGKCIVFNCTDISDLRECIDALPDAHDADPFE